MDGLKKIINSKGLPLNLVGTTLVELLLICLVILGCLASSYYIFGRDTTSNFVDFIVLVWLFLIGRRLNTVNLRLNENDERDQDFRDEVDRRFENNS